MDSTNSASPDSVSRDVVLGGNNNSESVQEDLETTCWGCGLCVVVSPYAPVFKCGWCGAITNQNAVKIDNNGCWWRRFRDRCFVSVVIIFMIFFICAGIFTIYPVAFSISFFCGVFHLTIAVMLSISTLTLFYLSALRPSGPPPIILWGSYPTVGRCGLENHTFCQYCSRPKPPGTHHCRACRMCILKMDHHCPFIGNCVGAANHRVFVLFLISSVTSMLYVAIWTSYTALYLWPRLDSRFANLLDVLANKEMSFRVSKDLIALLRSTAFLSMRGLVLVYLLIASISVGFGLSVLLWQQLGYIYVGKTYLSHLTAVNSDETLERDCRNLIKFFGCPHSAAAYLPSYWKSSKSHRK